MFLIEIQGLFNRFDYKFELKEEGITILTGPNGFGKSTILKCIDELSREFEGLYYLATSIEFKKIIFQIDGDSYRFEKSNNHLIINDNSISLIPFKKLNISLNSRNTISKRYKEANHMIVDTYGRKEYQKKDYILEYIEEYIIRNEEEMDIKKIEVILNKLALQLKQVYFVSEQRILKAHVGNRNDLDVIDTIKYLPNELKNIITNYQTKYSKIATELDSTYPKRLFITNEEMNETQFSTKMDELINKYEILNKYKLVTTTVITNVEFKNEFSKALKIYFDDFEKKYKEYESLIDELNLFTDIINDKLLFKKLVISPEYGFILIEEDTGNEIDLETLSSGEKQLIILFYNLIFNAESDCYLLIDEPEISLHIIWQKKFMDDLLRIIDYKGFNVIVATHSPQIINNHWDRQVDLGELYGKQLNKR